MNTNMGHMIDCKTLKGLRDILFKAIISDQNDILTQVQKISPTLQMHSTLNLFAINI